MAADGFDFKEIAHKLCVSQSAIEKRITQKETMNKSLYISQRCSVSLLNITIIYAFTELFFLFNFDNTSRYNLFFVLYFIYLMICLLFFKNINIGMYFFKSNYKKKYSFTRLLFYNFLYTISASTIYLNVFFFLDVFLINIFCIQCLMLFKFNKTTHSYFTNVELENFTKQVAYQTT